MAALRIANDPPFLARMAAAEVVTSASVAIQTRGRFTIALSGGNTPRPAYELLVTHEFASQVDWSRVHVFWSDERCVPPTDAESNFRTANESLLRHVPIPPANVHRIEGEADPPVAAASYERVLDQFFPPKASGAPSPSFDLAILGLGANGHTASLFPGRPALREKRHQVVADYIGAVFGWRITLTLPILNEARATIFLVTGAAKANVLHQVLEGPFQPNVLPAQLIQPSSGRLTWLVDAPAAARLTIPSH